MPFAGDIQLRLGPLEVRSCVRFGDKRGFHAGATLDHVDEERLRRAFMRATGASSERQLEEASQAGNDEQCFLKSEDLELVLNEFQIDLANNDDICNEFVIPFLKSLPSNSKPTKSRRVPNESKEGDLEGDEADSESKHQDESKEGDIENQESDGLDGDEESKSDKPSRNERSKKTATLDNLGVSRELNYAQLCALFSELYAPYYIYGKELNRACARGDLYSMRQLVARGCNPNPCAQGIPCTTPLHSACETGNEEACKLLFEWLDESGINAADPDGWTPLIVAAANNQTKVISLLLKQRADINLCTSTGRSALHWAAAKRHIEACKTFVSEGASALTKARDCEGLTPLHYASLSDEEDLVAVLLKAGASKDEACNSTRVPRDLCQNEDDAERMFGALKKK